MKKVLLILSVLLILVLAVSCGSDGTTATVTTSGETDNGATDVTSENAITTEASVEAAKILTLKGPTGMGMAKMMNDSALNGNKDYEFNVFNAPDLIKTEILMSKYDIAAVPTNVAAALYQRTNGAFKVAAVNTLGVLYIVENGNTVNSIADLKGKTLYCTGGGSTPEYIIRYVLTKNGIDPDKDITLDFSFTEHAELASYVAGNSSIIAMLPEPNVTAAVNNNASTRIVLDINDEWNKVSETGIMQGCVIVNNDFASKHPEQLAQFLTDYKASVEFVNANVEEASQMIQDNGILPSAAVAKKCISRCNITFIDKETMKTNLSAFLAVLYNADKTSVGGSLPNDGFYYINND